MSQTVQDRGQRLFLNRGLDIQHGEDYGPP